MPPFLSRFHSAFSPSNRLEQTGFSDRVFYQPRPEAVHEKDMEKEGQLLEVVGGAPGRKMRLGVTGGEVAYPTVCSVPTQ